MKYRITAGNLTKSEKAEGIFTVEEVNGIEAVIMPDDKRITLEFLLGFVVGVSRQSKPKFKVSRISGKKERKLNFKLKRDLIQSHEELVELITNDYYKAKKDANTSIS